MLVHLTFLCFNLNNIFLYLWGISVLLVCNKYQVVQDLHRGDSWEYLMPMCRGETRFQLFRRWNLLMFIGELLWKSCGHPALWVHMPNWMLQWMDLLSGAISIPLRMGHRPSGGCQRKILPKFPKNRMKLRTFWAVGGFMPGVNPLRSTNGCGESLFALSKV